jgi:hypothetical protein
MSDKKEERIRAEAYRRWEQEGRPHGQHDRHWREAAAAVENGHATDIIESEGTTQVLKAPKVKVAKPKAPKAAAAKAAAPKVAANEAKPKAPKAAAAKAVAPKVVADEAKPDVAAPKRTRAKKAAAE